MKMEHRISNFQFVFSYTVHDWLSKNIATLAITFASHAIAPRRVSRQALRRRMNVTRFLWSLITPLWVCAGQESETRKMRSHPFIHKSHGLYKSFNKNVHNLSFKLCPTRSTTRRAGWQRVRERERPIGLLFIVAPAMPFIQYEVNLFFWSVGWRVDTASSSTSLHVSYSNWKRHKMQVNSHFCLLFMFYFSSLSLADDDRRFDV